MPPSDAAAGVLTRRLRSAAGLIEDVGEAALSVARTRLGGRPVPRVLTYIVTFRCNARCVMCDSWRKEPEDELRTDEIDRIFAQLPPLHAVRLSGGEPTLRTDLVDIAALAVKHLQPRLLHLTTNGFLTDRVVRFCESRPRDTRLEVLVSVDGEGAKHDEVRGRRGAWDQAYATLAALAPRQRELNLELAVNQTIVDAEGARHYRLLRERLRPLGVRHQMVMAYDASATYSLTRETDVAPREVGTFSTHGRFERDEIESLLAEAERDAEALPASRRLAKRYYLRGIRTRLLENRGDPNPPCVALTSHLRLYPNGDVPTCQFNSKRVGNLRTQTFAELWTGQPAAKQRAWVRDCPGCWAECEVVPNAVYSGDLLRALRPRGL